jgi:hypothetical protein
LIVVVLVFSLSWLPINLINLVKDLGYDIATGSVLFYPSRC